MTVLLIYELYEIARDGLEMEGGGAEMWFGKKKELIIPNIVTAGQQSVDAMWKRGAERYIMEETARQHPDKLSFRRR